MTDTSKIETLAMCCENLKRVKIELEGRVIQQVTEFTYLGNMICECKPDTEINMHKYNKLNRLIKRHPGKQISEHTKRYESTTLF
jgi:hypothetical protein